MLVAPAVVTAWAGVVGVVSDGAALPCGQFCRGTSPDPSAELWMVAGVYPVILLALSAERVIAVAQRQTRFGRRGRLVVFAAVSAALVVWTPRTWFPLRAAYLLGALFAVVALLLADRLAARLFSEP